jgi:two-component system alkaline phosphatase synthesis response regulator PhoP
MEEAVKVLLIEDDVRVRELYELVLKMDEYHVITAETGEDGLVKAKSENPDLIFLDIRLPGMNGLEVLEILRQDEKTAAIPVVILSNLDDEKTINRGVSLGALEYVVKSRITPQDLSKRVKDFNKKSTH